MENKTGIFLSPIEQKEYYRNGKIKAHYFMLEGNIDGEFKKWHNNGQMEVYTFFNKGELVGEYFEWNREGNPIQPDVYRPNI